MSVYTITNTTVIYLQLCTVLGEHVLSAAFEGYNSCVFAYGQSGTGKTYALFGNEQAPGLIQHVNEELFKKATSSDPATSYRAEIRYFLGSINKLFLRQHK